MKCINFKVVLELFGAFVESVSNCFGSGCGVFCFHFYVSAHLRVRFVPRIDHFQHAIRFLSIAKRLVSATLGSRFI